MFEVATITVKGKPTAIGSAGPFTVVVDRPVEAGGGGVVEIDGDAPPEGPTAIVRRVDGIAEIPKFAPAGNQCPSRLGGYPAVVSR